MQENVACGGVRTKIKFKGYAACSLGAFSTARNCGVVCRVFSAVGESIAWAWVGVVPKP